MKTITLAAAAAFALSASAAFAADLPSQDPFRHFEPGRTVTGAPSFVDQGSAAYPDPANFPSFARSPVQPLPAQGNEAIVETANSLPSPVDLAAPGFGADTRQASLQRSFGN